MLRNTCFNCRLPYNCDECFLAQYRRFTIARLAILSLGALHITLDDAPLTGFDSDKARGLLVYLAMESDREHPRESLAGLLWPEFPEQRARHTLSQVLYNVRQVIGDRAKNHESPFLHVTSQTLRFNRASHHWLDVARFVAPLPISTLALSNLEASAALYRGHFLEGFSLGDSPAFEEWVLMQRERLQRAALEIFSQLAAGHAQQRHYDRALFYAWQQLDLDPWREDAHRQVMRLLALSGRRTAALAHYDACRHKLLDEVGVEPEAETTELYVAVKAGDFESPSPRAPIPHHNLPAQLTPLVGRETELASLRMRLRDPACRLLTLVGPGGIGKTRLALEAVAPLVSDFDHGVFFVDLTPLQSADAIIPTVARILNFTFSDKGGSQEQQLLAYLKNKALLLVLDNVEHLLYPVNGREIATECGMESAATVEVMVRLLESAPDVKIVATSRTPLNVLGEHRFPVGALAYPQQTTAELAAVQDLAAVRLFVQSARQSRPDFALAAHNAQAVSDICRYVQGVPLAILLTAAWSATLSTADIAALLTGDAADGPGRGLDFLEMNCRNVPSRHHSLRAVFEHSWRLLGAREQNVFRVLSVFRGGFTLAAVQAVADATPQALRVLVNASFLYREPSGRYTIQGLLRQYAAEKLADDPVLAQKAHDRHCAHYIAALQPWAEDAKGPRQQDVLLEMDVEIGNARAAWDWAVIHQQTERMIQGMEGLRHFYDRRARYPEMETACRSAVEHLHALEKLTTAELSLTGEELRLLVRVLTWHSTYLKVESARLLLEKVLALLDRTPLGDTRFERAAIAVRMGQLHKFSDPSTRQYYEQGLELYRELGERWHVAYTLRLLGWRAWHTAHYAEAKQRFNDMLSTSQALGDLWGIAKALMGLSGVAFYMGQSAESICLSQESLEIRRKIGSQYDIATGLYSLGNKYIGVGDYPEAYTVMQESIAIYNDLGMYDSLVFVVIALVEIHLGRYAHARVRLHRELLRARGENLRLVTGFGLYALGWATVATLDYDEAYEALHESIAIYREIEEHGELGQALSLLGYTLLKQGQPDQARNSFVDALHIIVAIRSWVAALVALPGIALLYLENGQLVQAIEFYALASRYPLIANSRWVADIVDRPIEDTAASLPPEVIAAAQARGRARDVQATVAELLALLQTA
ncbi:MAG: tetratricopeptide repeat protein [Anaerolineae bacterium]|nr:tetratricopeptide repeat protein [Anaerolineae bacterium]